MRLVDLVDIDPFIGSEESGDSTGENKFRLPEVIGILPIRSAVAYPGTVMPLAIGRSRSRELINETTPHETIFGLVTQKDPSVEEPGPNDLYQIGTAASVLKVIKMPQGSINIIVHGIARFKILEYVSTKPYLKAKVEFIAVKTRKTKKLQAQMVNIRDIAGRVVNLSPNIPDEASVLLDNIQDPSALADFLAATLNIPLEEKQMLLEEPNASKRLEKVALALANQLEVLELSHKIQGQIRDSVDKSQRDFFLQEELKAIQAELGQNDRKTEDINELEARIKKAKMPPKVTEEAMRELDRMSRTPSASPEYSVSRTYLEWVCDLPWSMSTIDSMNIVKAEKILNRDHYGLVKIKKRILEFLAVRKLNPKGKSPILCFVGPPGVGKTSLGQSIARAMSRKFIRISLGGIRDEADIRGHRRTYIGALPGRILQELRKCGHNNPVFMLDELDKIGQDFRGDPASALLEVLDPEQNYTFTDHYIDQPFDLSGVMFIGTANYTEPIPPALMDRMEIIELPGYTEREKTSIAKKYLIPRQLKEHGLKKTNLTIKDETLGEIINSYTREAGVRNLERTIASACRHVAMKIAKGTSKRATIGKAQLSEILGPHKFESDIALRTAVPGVVTALAYTPMGGEILFIESAAMPGKGKLIITGQLGEVMKESTQAAFSVVKANADKLNIDTKQLSQYDLHVHVPAGAVPKDGPSAGIAIFTSLVSLFTKRPALPTVAMTGEITLKGLVLPIGGLKEKVLAAKRAGIETVIMPARNKKDLIDLPKEAKSKMKFVFVKKADKVLKHVLK
ncbi:MAG: endopeptidase La [Sedimentisphaerales bacterium]|nr:endopeptidase La [Sedimentisphaerales bacterium]